ncbi:hypothetical protein GUJ93_ZPchr0013g36418 [Zizania palustris]|uniref:rRNA N-glycosylase n=1 Tax=Zizania palustris TaxID=103762 RepID=A0A8J6C473_ZIZPA|nr:hypothetical protein GUJ93_ZPchr0013g36418 [Zizania palustris]
MRPFKWLILELLGTNGNKIMLAIRRDNLYVTSFTDRTGLWYIFNNRPRSLIPMATVTRFGDNYHSLIGGDSNLNWVRVSKQTIIEAIEHVAIYDPRRSTDVARALAIIVVMFVEASRFQPFQDLVQNSWESGAYVGTLSKLVTRWKIVSCALMVAVQKGVTATSWGRYKEVKDMRANTHIDTFDDAVHTIKVAIWPLKEKCSKTITWLR